jgi:antitoxin component YwqK of YwqJK toxin-antitoxin module
MAHCNYEDGKLHGIHETFYENGQIHSRGIYVHGKLDGIYQIWNEKGKLENSYTYDNNNL